MKEINASIVSVCSVEVIGHAWLRSVGMHRSFRLFTNRKKPMALNPFKNNFVVGVTAGLVAAAIAPVLLPAIKRSSRPMAKSLIKGGMLLYEKGREAAANAGEMVEDVMAEIHAEESERQGAAAEAESDAQAHTSGEHGANRFSAVKHEAMAKDQGTSTS